MENFTPAEQRYWDYLLPEAKARKMMNSALLGYEVWWRAGQPPVCVDCGAACTQDPLNDFASHPKSDCAHAGKKVSGQQGMESEFLQEIRDA